MEPQYSDSQRGVSIIEVMVALMILAISFAGSTRLLAVMNEASVQGSSQYLVISELRYQLRMNGRQLTGRFQGVDNVTRTQDLCGGGAFDILLPNNEWVTPVVRGCGAAAEISINGMTAPGIAGRLALSVSHASLGGELVVGGEPNGV